MGSVLAHHEEENPETKESVSPTYLHHCGHVPDGLQDPAEALRRDVLVAKDLDIPDAALRATFALIGE